MGEKLKQRNVLIAGGTGFIGQALTNLLLENGYKVKILSRIKQESKPGVDFFHWDTEAFEIDIAALEDLDIIVNLSGEDISKKRWSNNRKEKIIKSRVNSARTLYKAIKVMKNKPNAYISAGAIGIYGTVTSEIIYKEDDNFGIDFLADVCQEWESATQKFTPFTRTVVLRTGLALGKNHSIIKKILSTRKLGLISILGSGKQYMSWVHVEDVARAYLFAIENEEMNGAYNIVAPEHINHEGFIQKLRKKTGLLKKTPAIPAYMITSVFGNMSSLLLYGSRISSEKIRKAGFEFQYPGMDQALDDII